MEWGSDFKAQLADLHNRAYAPMFRLQIGSTVMTARHFGAWELEAGGKVLEILSHPGTATVADYSGWSPTPELFGRGATSMGFPYAYLVGLTGKLSTGAQAVQPRTFVYTGATLTAGVTRMAATHAARMPEGVLARLQIRLDPASVPSHVTDWEDIWIGVYQGVKWSGTDYTLSFVDALQQVKQKHTEAATTSAPEDYYKWFAGCGKTTTLTDGWPGGTAYTTRSTLAIAVHPTYADRYNFGKTAKKHDGFEGDRFHYSTDPPGTGDLLQWVKASNTSGSKTYLSYNVIATSGSDSTLIRAETGGTSGSLPGFEGIGAGSTAVTNLDAGSVITNVCVIHGTPVTELVNTIYNQGYPAEMVPGLFAPDWGRASSHPESPMNLADIARISGLWTAAFQASTGAPATGIRAPFRHVVIKEQADGLSYMLRLFGKWGVFPRFKEGGWSVGFMSTDVLKGWTPQADAVIFTDDIEGADYNTRASGTLGGFAELHGDNSKDEDGVAVEPFSGIVFTGGWTYYGQPQLGRLTVDTTNVAAGSSAASGARGQWGQRFLRFFRDHLYGDWYQRNRKTTTVRLRGLKFAGLAPGDRVHICIPRAPDGRTVEPWGPLEPRAGSSEHVLDSSGFVGTHAEAKRSVTVSSIRSLNAEPWIVVSQQVDWVGCRVTVTLSKADNSRGAKDWTGFPGGTTKGQGLTGVADLQHRDD